MTNKNYDWRQDNFGRLINVSIGYFEERVLELTAERSHIEFRISHLALTRNLDIEGTRSSELAKRASMTKQAMSEIVAYCESIGLVYRVPDPTDARARIVLFTEAGLEWMEVFRGAVETAEQELAELVGADALANIKKALQTYRAANAAAKA